VGEYFRTLALRIVKKLLSAGGIMIIEIGDWEYYTIRLVMDEIFLENNISEIIRAVHSPRGKNDDKHFASMHKYLLIYSRNS
jgi:adenine-specific DNA-methyltransferase